jgi:hypothetical protein
MFNCNVHGSVHRNNILVYNSNLMHKSQSLFYIEQLSDKINSLTCASSWNYILEGHIVIFIFTHLFVMFFTRLCSLDVFRD